MRYLSTLQFDETWLAEVRRQVPGVDVVQVTAEKVSDVPDEVWADVTVLHTSAVLPDPAQAPALRWVQLDTSGCDHLHGSALWASDIAITTIGGVSPVPLAEYVLFAVLGFAHRLPELLAAREQHHWPSPEQRWRRLMPRAVPGATLGIVGYGRIGREIARLAQAHGMHVLGVNRTGRLPQPDELAAQVDFGRSPAPAAAGGVELFTPDRLPEVAARSDYLVVVAPLTPDTRGLVGRAVFDAVKPGAVLVNAARGGIVDEDAVRDALRAGRLAGAVLDVFDDEPLPPDSTWWSEPNVVVTPHVAGLAPDYYRQVQEIVVENLRRFRAGRPLLNLVDRERGY